MKKEELSSKQKKVLFHVNRILNTDEEDFIFFKGNIRDAYTELKGLFMARDSLLRVQESDFGEIISEKSFNIGIKSESVRSALLFIFIKDSEVKLLPEEEQKFKEIVKTEIEKEEANFDFPSKKRQIEKAKMCNRVSKRVHRNTGVLDRIPTSPCNIRTKFNGQYNGAQQPGN